MNSLHSHTLTTSSDIVSCQYNTVNAPHQCFFFFLSLIHFKGLTSQHVQNTKSPGLTLIYLQCYCEFAIYCQIWFWLQGCFLYPIKLWITSVTDSVFNEEDCMLEGCSCFGKSALVLLQVFTGECTIHAFDFKKNHCLIVMSFSPPLFAIISSENQKQEKKLITYRKMQLQFWTLVLRLLSTSAADKIRWIE